MKKVTILALLFVFAAGIANTQAATIATRTGVVKFDEKVKIKKEELPDAVRTALTGNDYKGWEISECYMWKESGNYEVELKNGDQKKTVKLDKDGKVVE
ncbi:MAG TPA: hypothetical protein VF473_07050 [Cyclobacteriaceae bacterium]